jgi:hypothetical protein
MKLYCIWIYNPNWNSELYFNILNEYNNNNNNNNNNNIP